MKKLIIWGITILLTINSFAQEELKLDQAIKFPFKISKKSISTDRKYVLCSDNDKFALIETETGKILWTIVAKEKFGFDKTDFWAWECYNDSVNLSFYYKKSKETKYITVNKQTAEIIPGSSRTGIEKEEAKSTKSKNVYYEFKEPDKGVTIKLIYTPKLVVSSASSSDAVLKVTCEGKHTWEQTVNAKVMRTLYSNSSMTREIADYLNAYVQGDKVFVIYDGFSVLDINSGKLLWQAGFDYVNFDFGLTKCTQEYPKAPFPYLDNNIVYVTDMHKDALELRALDANSGNITWKSEKYDKNALVSNMFFVNGNIINQFGGRIFRQVYKAGVGQGSRETWITENYFPEDGGFKSYDAKTGKLIWSTFDKKEFASLKKRSTNSLIKNNTIFVATEKELLQIDATSGSLKLTVPLSKLKIGLPKDISFLNNNIFIQATEGYAMYTIDGTLVYSTPTKEILKTEVFENTYIVWIGKSIFDLNEFLCFNPVTGKIIGKIGDTSYPYFFEDGKFLIKFDGNKEIQRYKMF